MYKRTNYIFGSVVLKFTYFSDNSQSFLALDSSDALGLSLRSAQSIKYFPVTPSSSVEQARSTLVWHPCLGVLKKPKKIITYFWIEIVTSILNQYRHKLKLYKVLKYRKVSSNSLTQTSKSVSRSALGDKETVSIWNMRGALNSLLWCWGLNYLRKCRMVTPTFNNKLQSPTKRCRNISPYTWIYHSGM